MRGVVFGPRWHLHSATGAVEVGFGVGVEVALQYTLEIMFNGIKRLKIRKRETLC